MDQKFNADCVVNIHVEPMARSKRFIWVCSIIYLDQRILTTRALVKSDNREEAELLAMRYGLRQTTQLKQEKVELRCSFGEWLSTARPRKKELQLVLEENKSLWNDFRLKRCLGLPTEEKEFLQGNAQALFFKKKEGRS